MVEVIGFQVDFYMGEKKKCVHKKANEQEVPKNKSITIKNNTSIYEKS